MREMIDLARDASPPLPPPSRREEVRTMLLAAGRSADVLAPRRSNRLLYAVAAGALATAAAIALVVILHEPARPARHFHATVRPLAGAQFTATQSAPDEIVFLRDGSIDVEVAPLHAGERFRVVLADAEVEVHGTRFVATATAGKLASVDVAHGIVEVRARGATAVLLRVGESWRAPMTASVATPAPTPDPEPPVPSPPNNAVGKTSVVVSPPIAASPPRTAPSTSPTVAAPPRTAPPQGTPPSTSPPVTAPSTSPATPRDRVERLPQERAYDDGWAAMRGGKFAEAAIAFARVQLLDPDGALAEDATYWYAVALARSKDDAQATRAFRDFVDQYPKSRRAGEASAMLGWLLVTAHENAEAERRFRAATNDSNPAVRESARAGLDAVRDAR
jgi:TolA-binding protein